MKKLYGFIMKIGLEMVNLLFNNGVFFYILKRLNLIDQVFCVYPASENYAKRFAFSLRLLLNKWTPFVIGFSVHEGRIGLTFAISAIDSEIKDPIQGDNLKAMNKSMEEICKKVGATSIHYAGIIPSYLRQRGVERDEIEQRVTVVAVMEAVKELSIKHNLKTIVLIGSGGYIGGSVAKVLSEEGYSVIGVEKGETYTTPDQIHMVLNISEPYAISSHIEKFNHSTILLNEVYPAPSNGLLASIKKSGAEVWHIVGLEGKMFPSLGGDYHGAIPCCGGFEGQSKVVIKKI